MAERAGRREGQFKLLVGEVGAEAVTMMVSGEEQGPSNPLATAISFAVLLFAASNVFAELQDALDTVWGVAALPRRRAIFAFLRQRFVSFAMVMGVCFLLLVSLVINAGLAVVEQRYFTGRAGDGPRVVTVHQVASFASSRCFSR